MYDSAELIFISWNGLENDTFSKYGKFLFSSNTLAVRTPKIILKLLLKTFSFSSNIDFFLCNRIFNTSNTTKMQETMLERHKTVPDF